MIGYIEKLLNERRTLEKALADLRAKYQREPRPELVRMIEILRVEIELSKRPVKPSWAVYDQVLDRTGPALARMLPS